MVPFREEMAKRFLKVTGDLGRVVFMVRMLQKQLNVETKRRSGMGLEEYPVD